MPSPASAAPVVWHLGGASLGGGGTASGTFTYDADTNTYSNVNITISRGATTQLFTEPIRLDLHNASTAIFGQRPDGSDQVGAHITRIRFLSPLTNGGGTSTINTVSPNSFWGVCNDASCTVGIGVLALYNGGVVTTDTPQAPTITTTGPLAVAENTTAVVDVDSTDDYNSEGSHLTYSLGGVDANLFTIGSADGIIAFVNPPDFEAPFGGGDNDYEITVTVTDQDGLFNSVGFVVNVEDVNETPTLTAIADQSVDEGQSTSIPISSTDPDSDPLTLSATGLPAFCTLTDNTNGAGTIDCSPGFTDAATYPITVTSTDNGTPPLNTTQPFDLIVNNTTALMVVGSVNSSGLPPGRDRPVVDLVESLGLEVTLVNDDDVTLADADPHELIVVSSSVVPSTIGAMFRDVAVPVVTWEGYLFDDFAFTTGSNGETSTTQTQLTVVDDQHPLSAGFSGLTTVSTEATKFSRGTPVAAGQVAAQVGSIPVLFGFEAGDTLAGANIAPARRVGLFMNYVTAGRLTTPGRDMVAAAIGWAISTGGIPVNAPPSVSAGPDQTVQSGGSISVDLDGTVSDDGRPVPPALVSSEWTTLDAGVTFTDDTAVDTTVLLPGPGTYVLTLTADDTELSSTDTVTITVNEPSNEAPEVDAGSTISITLPTNSAGLLGLVSDDGLPLPSDLSIEWTVFSGPAGVTFDDATSPTAIATFPGAGQYVLQLNADDGELNDSDRVTVNVDAELPAGINIAFVSSRSTLPAGDRPIRDRLVDNGATVTVVDDDALLASYNQFDLIWLSTSVVYTKIGDHFADTTIPVVLTEQYLLDDMNMGSARIGVKNTTKISIIAPGHELAASNSGDTTITSSATALGFAQPGPGAEVIATASGQAVYFSYETGDEMIGGNTAPARRVAFPGAYATGRRANNNWRQMLDAAVAFALG